MDTWGDIHTQEWEPFPRDRHPCPERGEQAPNLNPHHYTHMPARLNTLYPEAGTPPPAPRTVSTQGQEHPPCPGDVASGLAFSKCPRQSCQMNSQKATAQHV